MKSKLIYPILFCLIIGFSQINLGTLLSYSLTIQKIIPKLSYNPSSPILINSDSELDLIANYGNGSLLNPYVITNKSINASYSGSAIYIRNTRVFLQIFNCELYNAGNQWGDAGIRINNCSNIIIINNDIHDNGYFGMMVYSSNLISIKNSSIGRSIQNGIYCYNSRNVILLQNNILSNLQAGIRSLYSFNVSCEGNVLFNNSYGIYFSSTNQSRISF